MIDNFNADPEKNWRFVADTVMGGVSTGTVSFKTENGNALAKMTGTVSTENNGGFIQFRRKIPSSVNDSVQGVQLTVRGNGELYYVHIRTSGTILPWQYYQAPFETQKSWRNVRIPISAFKRSGWVLRKSISPSSIKSVAIVAFGRDHEVDVQLSEIKWY
ncbi:MAG: CIA30 family protein [Hyphomicrobiales bacterium]